jgi:hypothetical protein
MLPATIGYIGYPLALTIIAAINQRSRRAWLANLAVPAFLALLALHFFSFEIEALAYSPMAGERAIGSLLVLLAIAFPLLVFWLGALALDRPATTFGKVLAAFFLMALLPVGLFFIHPQVRELKLLKLR